MHLHWMNWNSWAILYKKLCIFQVSAKYMCNSHRVLQSRCWAQLNFYVPLWMSLSKKNLSIISKNISTYKSYSNKIIKEKRWRTSKCKIADHRVLFQSRGGVNWAVIYPHPTCSMLKMFHCSSLIPTTTSKTHYLF